MAPAAVPPIGVCPASQAVCLTSAQHSCPTKPGRDQRALPRAAGTSDNQSVEVLGVVGILIDIGGGSGVWGLPERQAKNVHAHEETSASRC